MALLLKSKDIILRRTCTMPLIGQKNPKGLDIDLRMKLIIKRFSQNQFSVLGLRTLARPRINHRLRANARA